MPATASAGVDDLTTLVVAIASEVGEEQRRHEDIRATLRDPLTQANVAEHSSLIQPMVV